MGLPPKQAGDCHAAVPVEFPTSPAKISQNIKNLMREIAALKCRFNDFEESALTDENACDVCCPPCGGGKVPDSEPVPFDGKPFENIYADGKIWIGDISSNSDRIYAVFDPINHVLITDLFNTDIAGSGMKDSCGFGACWRQIGNQVWVSGFNATNALLRVYNAESLTAVVEYEYAGTVSAAPNAIEWCPLGDTIFAAIQADDNSYSVVQIDPTDGSVIRTFKPVAESGFENEEVFYMTWHGGERRMYCHLLRDQQFHIPVAADGTAGDATTLGCPIGGLIDTGHKVPESVWSPVSGLMYLIPDKHHDLYSFPGEVDGPVADLGCANASIQPILLVDFKPDVPTGIEGSHVEYVSAKKALVVSLGNDNILSSDPNSNGEVRLYSHDGAVLQTWEVPFAPARVAHAPIANNIAAVSWWNQDTQWFVQFLGLDLLPGEGSPDTGGGEPGGGSSGGSGGGGGGGSNPDPPPSPPPPDDPPNEPPGIPTPGVEDPLNGPTLNATGRSANVIGLVDADNGGHVGPAAELQSLHANYNPGGHNPPQEPWGPGWASMHAFFTSGGIAGQPTHAFNNQLVSYYVMRENEHPTTHPTVDPESLDTAVRKALGAGIDEDLWHGSVQYDAQQSLPPAVAAGSVPIRLDFYFRWEKPDPIIPGIWVSHWTIIKLRTFTTADPE
jgi:hypothetical protein